MTAQDSYTVLLRQTIASQTDQLHGVRQLVEVEALRFGFDSDTAFRLALAADEACTNIIKHSYQNQPGQTIELAIATENDNFIIAFTDYGRSYNPQSHRAVDMQEYLRQMLHGGLGVHIIKLVVDDVQYSSNGNGKSVNELRLIKHRGMGI